MDENQKQPTNKIMETPQPLAPEIGSHPQAQTIKLSFFQRTKKKLKQPKVLALIILLLVLISGCVVVFANKYNTENAQTTTTPSASVAKSNVANSDLIKDRTFLRYQDGAAYEQDKDGKTKTVTNQDGEVLSVRKKSFEVTIEKDSTSHNISLDNKVVNFGYTKEHSFYALSCEVPKFGEKGADNASFTVQFYDQTGKKLQSAKWREQDTDRPVVLGDYCAPSTFMVSGSAPEDFSARGYGRELVDDLNYKVVNVKSDGFKQTIDTEDSADIDIPLGASPDKKVFLYNRVSAKRVAEGCGEETQLAYKIPDYAGPINELHSVNLATGKDTLLGTEDSLSVPDHHINLSLQGYFSSDGGRYYLKEGSHGGCTGGNSLPIRIAYINLRTNKLETITSPAGKEYSEYCFTDDGKYVLESGVVDDFNDSTPAKPLSPPTILNTQDGTTYQSDDLTTAFDCLESAWVPNTFTALKKTTTLDEKNNWSKDKALISISSFNPATRSAQTVTFKKPIDISKGSIESIVETSKAGINYINLLNSSDDKYTILFDAATGETVEIPYAQIVL